MEKEGPLKIGEIPFLDVMIAVYHDKYGKAPNSPDCLWKHRNPDSFYQGPVFMSYTGKIEYPEGAVIPEQTERDREIIPVAIITCLEEIDDEFKKAVGIYLEKSHKIRNGIKDE